MMKYVCAISCFANICYTRLLKQQCYGNNLLLQYIKLELPNRNKSNIVLQFQLSPEKLYNVSILYLTDEKTDSRN